MNKESDSKGDGVKRWLRSKGVALGLLVACLNGAYYYLWIWNPLISDEEMIAHFQAHRAEFEELANRYREHLGTPDTKPWLWHQQKDIAELMARAGIKYIDSTAPAWLPPEPYSGAAAKTINEQILAGQGYLLWRKYGALDFTPVPEPYSLFPKNSDRHRANTLPYYTIWKSYYHFPEAPRIENGQMLMPLGVIGRGFPGAIYHEHEGIYTAPIYRKRVLPSLNRFPDHWKDYECVYRQIDPQWFICMCNGH